MKQPGSEACVQMPCRITSQKEMQEARRKVSFCFLCGQALPKRGPKGHGEKTLGEHVIPRTLLGSPPSQPPDRWSIVLDVHEQCEQKDKQHVDHWIQMLQQMHVESKDRWPTQGHIRGMRLVPRILVDAVSGNAHPAFEGLDKLLDGVRQWVAGFHAAVYGEPLMGAEGRLVLPPVPAASTNPNGMTFSDVETQSYLTRLVVSRAVERDKWEGVTAWGERLQYRCVWWRPRRNDGPPAWVCFWTLMFPGVDTWSRQILGVGNERPWHGHYTVTHRPPESTALEADDFDSEDGDGV